MKKVVLASDSFKGTISSARICELAKSAAPDDIEIKCIPVADGGEGTVECFRVAVGAELVTLTVTGPYGEPVSASYARMGTTAIIEMAATCGLPLVGDRLNPSQTTTYGTGELINHALSHGCDKILLGLGGSSTNDGGCGIAAALGVLFYDDRGETFVPTGGTLQNIAHIDTSAAPHFDLTLMCDVTNPTIGSNGAAYVYGPQKGADAGMLILLDSGLAHMCEIIEKDLSVKVDTLTGGGAAGGTGAGMYAFLGGKIVSGIDAILDATSFADMLDDATLCITGEGKIDSQSINGKALSGISKLCKEYGVPLVAIAGIAEDEEIVKRELSLSEIYITNKNNLPFEIAARTAEADYTATIRKIFEEIERR